MNQVLLELILKKVSLSQPYKFHKNGSRSMLFTVLFHKYYTQVSQ